MLIICETDDRFSPVVLATVVVPRVSRMLFSRHSYARSFRRFALAQSADRTVPYARQTLQYWLAHRADRTVPRDRQTLSTSFALYYSSSWYAQGGPG